MEFLKKHYEKILLSIVLLGLGAAAAWLPMAIREAKEELQSRETASPQQKPLAAADLAQVRGAMEQAKNPPAIVLSGDHNLFNPVTWKRTSSNDLMKVLKEGTAALVVKKIQPLYTVISYERAAGSGFYIALQQQSMKKPSVYAKVNEPVKQGLFIVREAKGAAEDPGELVIELLENQSKVSIKKGQPYQQVDGYAADLFYEPETRKFNDRRVGQMLTFAGETYKIIAITENAVTVQANSTSKKTTITWNGTP